MKKHFVYLIILGCWLKGYGQSDSLRVDGNARVDSNARHRVAIFVPLFLDSAYDAGGNYRYDKSFPKFINPGLEFYEGVELALDTMRKEGVKLEVDIYDIKSVSKPIQQVVTDSSFAGTELILGAVMRTEDEQQ